MVKQGPYTDVGIKNSLIVLVPGLQSILKNSLLTFGCIYIFLNAGIYLISFITLHSRVWFYSDFITEGEIGCVFAWFTVFPLTFTHDFPPSLSPWSSHHSEYIYKEVLKFLSICLWPPGSYHYFPLRNMALMSTIFLWVHFNNG